jgi:hypothetical protein
MSDDTLTLTHKLLSRRRIPSIDDLIDHVVRGYATRGVVGVFFRQRKVGSLARQATDTDSVFLYFNSISFALDRKGNVKRYSDRFAVLKDFARFERLKGMQTFESDNLVLFCPESFHDDDVGALATLLIAFYMSSDVYDHYVETTTRRLLRDDGETVLSGVEAIARLVRARFRTSVGYYTATKLRRGRNAPSSFRLTVRSRGKVSGLMSSKELKSDVVRALQARESYSGRFGRQRKTFYYKIVPILFIEVQAVALQQDQERIRKRRPDARRPRWGALVLIDTKPIRGLCFSYARALVDEHVGATNYAVQLNTLQRLAARRATAQLRLLQAPFRGAADQTSEVRGFAQLVCDTLVQITPAHSATIRLLDPFDGVLSPAGAAFSESLSVSSSGATRISIGEENKTLNAFVFRSVREGEFVHIPDVTRPLPQKWKKRGLKSVSFRRRETKSELCLPIYKTGLCIGVLNVEAPTEHAFDRDLGFISGLPGQVGEFIDLVTRSSDAGWMPRLSFVHSAAHQREQLKKMLHDRPDILAQAERAERRMSPDYIDPDDNKRVATQSLLAKIGGFIEDTRADPSVPWTDILNIVGIPPVQLAYKQAHSLEVILENILQNASNHDNFRGAITLDFGVKNSGRRGDVRKLVISYGPPAKRIFGGACDRVGIAPQWDGKVFHLGMFLVGVHVRMLGGVLWVAQGQPKEVIDFKYVIQLPL